MDTNKFTVKLDALVEILSFCLNADPGWEKMSGFTDVPDNVLFYLDTDSPPALDRIGKTIRVTQVEKMLLWIQFQTDANTRTHSYTQNLVSWHTTHSITVIAIEFRVKTSVIGLTYDINNNRC